MTKATATRPTKPTKPTNFKKKSSGGSASVPTPLFEGALAGLFGGGGRARGKRSAKADALYEAQQIMYSAWESPDPKRRIALAQQALEVSPDCADAYEYKDDASAAWAWSRALLAFRKYGDDEQAKAALAEAKRTNPHVSAYLSGKQQLPKRLPDMIGFGDESEATSYVGIPMSDSEITTGPAS